MLIARQEITQIGKLIVRQDHTERSWSQDHTGRKVDRKTTLVGAGLASTSDQRGLSDLNDPAISMVLPYDQHSDLRGLVISSDNRGLASSMVLRFDDLKSGYRGAREKEEKKRKRREKEERKGKRGEKKKKKGRRGKGKEERKRREKERKRRKKGKERRKERKKERKEKKAREESARVRRPPKTLDFFFKSKTCAQKRCPHESTRKTCRGTPTSPSGGRVLKFMLQGDTTVFRHTSAFLDTIATRQRFDTSSMFGFTIDR